MTPSPTTSDRSAKLVRDLSRDLSRSRNSYFAASQSVLERDHTQNSHLDTKSSSEFNPGSDEIFMSTRQLDDTAKQLPHIRSTAKKFAYYNPPQPEPRVDTSMLEQEFQDFDQDASLGEESMSIEVGRGVRRSTRNTPNKFNQPSLVSSNPQVSIGDDSLYEVTGTPGNRPRLTARNTDGGERSNLRKEAQIRRAASLPQKDIETSLSRLGQSGARVSPGKSRRSGLADMHAKVTSEESLLDERPPTLTTSVKNTRFGNPRSRQSSAAPNGVPTRFTSGQGLDTTPQRAAIGTPRSAAANATQQSFMLPDLPNLTELVSGVYKDGTPVFSRSAKARSRFASGSYPNRADNGQPGHMPVESIPVPADEKALFTSLQLLKEKVAQLEQEKAESERRIEDYENEVTGLKAELDMQQNMRRSDSALGSTDGEGRSGKDDWRVEKTKLESSMQSLQNRLDRAERKVSVSDIATKRITQERDSLVTQLGVAFYNQEELKVENEALRTENEALRGEIDALQAGNDTLRNENETLRHQVAQVETEFQDETQKWTIKEAELQGRVEKTDRAILAENETLRAELLRAREQHDEETQHWMRKEAELRKASDKKARAEHTKLQSQNDELKAQLAEAKARREAEIRRWNSKEAEMRSKIERRDETIRQFQDMTQEEANQSLRQQNEDLRVDLARFKAQRESDSRQLKDKEAELREQLAQVIAEREQETQQWSKKETLLRGKIERREEALRDMQDTTREVLSTRDANPRSIQQDAKSGRKDLDTFNNCKSSALREKGNTRAEMPGRVEEETRNSRPIVTARPIPTSSVEKQTQITAVHQSENRFHSRRPSVPAAGKLSRKRSTQNMAPALGAHDASDNESTTDLDLRSNEHPYVPAVAASAVVDSVTFTEPPAIDVTYLSFMDGDEIAKLRKVLEEERAAARKRASIATSSQQRQSDTIGPTPSATAVRPHSLPRKSSMKDVTGAVKPNDVVKPVESPDAGDGHTGRFSINGARIDVEESPAKQDTAHSILSNSSRRRSTVPVEMTSAFILPDITLHRPTLASISPISRPALAPHDSKNCTMCRRASCNGDHGPSPSAPTNTDADLNIPTPIPVSSRSAAEDDVDATLRPAQPPGEALATVLKELEDELAHLKLELRGQETLLRAHDPALRKRKRKSVQSRIKELVRMIDIRADQVYALYDVLEGQKTGEEVAEEAMRGVEDTLQSLGIDLKEVRARKGKVGKRVVIEEVEGSEDESGDESGSESGREELPWEGISDAESVASGRSGRRRSKGY